MEPTATVIAEFPGSANAVSAALVLIVAGSAMLAVLRTYRRWRSATGFRDRRNARALLWPTLLLGAWGMGMAAHWLAVEATVYLKARKGWTQMSEGQVAGFHCGGRSASTVLLRGRPEPYLIRNCPGADAVRIGDTVRLTFVTGVYGDREITKLELLSDENPP